MPKAAITWMKKPDFVLYAGLFLNAKAGGFSSTNLTKKDTKKVHRVHREELMNYLYLSVPFGQNFAISVVTQINPIIAQ